ncbi:PepSY domain-containing protein [Mesobacillus maritimus]|uniref:PepSY domain-containing protein n=1 Tax=Mesobacillus maritimus TaxID=1643336 RepID=UPI00204110F9|nr:PepSY domain-containing protein [Mesobacillus maritimus]MCM3587919.1 PepSY domain-containing protein [Mesobacillus maritimus]MCM3670093.1 PepSY domain-containing protein [Mesobacillus maritimus]
MNWKYFFLGVSTGVAGAYLVKEATARKENVAPEQILEKVKNAFKKEGPITGSWINMTTETYFRFPIEHQVYKGGITRNLSGQSEQYEFIADAKTGTILETSAIT